MVTGVGPGEPARLRALRERVVRQMDTRSLDRLHALDRDLHAKSPPSDSGMPIRWRECATRRDERSSSLLLSTKRHDTRFPPDHVVADRENSSSLLHIGESRDHDRFTSDLPPGSRCSASIISRRACAGSDEAMSVPVEDSATASPAAGDAQ